MTLTAEDVDLVQGVALRSITRNSNGRWLRHRVEVPVSDGLRLDGFAEQGLIELTPTGAGYSVVRLTAKGENAMQEAVR